MKLLHKLTMKEKNIKKVVLAYSGGLDTSIIVKWLQDNYNCEVITYTADLGQKGEIESAKKRAKELGVNQIFLDDCKEEFVKEYVFPMLRANTLYEEEYLLGTAIARPLISKKLIEVAKKCDADAISHGATGKGNDQVRFELSAYSLNPDIKIIAPWREWELNSRDKLLSYATSNNISVDLDKKNTPPYSMDANILHISYEGKVLVDQVNGVDALDFPAGTGLAPVKSNAFAKSIADTVGLRKVEFIGNATIGGTDNFDGFDIIGQSTVASTITINSSASVINSNIYL